MLRGLFYLRRDSTLARIGGSTSGGRELGVDQLLALRPQPVDLLLELVEGGGEGLAGRILAAGHGVLVLQEAGLELVSQHGDGDRGS